MISSSYLRLMTEREVKNLREAIDILHVKPLEYADVIRACLSSQSTDQSEIRRITVGMFNPTLDY
ncbi:E3 ubiquitin-protein ligase BRE1-like 2 isoform X1 [Prunus yedoensis var. nudiflora]|uniref:E3 ubiquitin-protein ligase BRE1-like 2 isoform X1 n=1 Tax=Prunus yedoensis var. nudiflora TaxID=2094558 RepID=A0A314Y209_PRUYE|nr:E3 ubiquitin-protein ligase BRE1-like 2 isoform X1 [Prunus yedoensis var. nudiflora]